MDYLRYTAFSSDPAGGNAAGVVLDAGTARDAEMLALAADLGYSETAFVWALSDREFDVRYFSPLAEVPFCGHATIATAVAIAARDGTGPLVFNTAAGRVDISTAIADDGPTATLISVPPRTASIEASDKAELLAALRVATSDLDAGLPMMAAYAGAWHPVVALAERDRLAALDYDFDRLGALMARRDWTTIDVVWRAAADAFVARNPFPPGGVVEDPVTGAAAAAFGGYLREIGAVHAPARITIEQGEFIGRPGQITVDIPAGIGTGISVTGTAVAID